MTQDLNRLLPGRFTANAVWDELAQAVGDQMSASVWPYVELMRDFHYPEQIEADMLPILAGYLGFGIKTTLFQESDYRRVIAALAEYWQQSGTAVLSKFISYANRSIFAITVKWSTDYITFYSAPGGTTIYEGGAWFPTPHVDVQYDGAYGDLPIADVRALFYRLAPVHLVMDALVKVRQYSTILYVGAGYRRSTQRSYAATATM